MGKFAKFKKDYKDSLKSLDTEETIDLLFYRPIGYMWALLGEKLGINTQCYNNSFDISWRCRWSVVLFP